MIDGMKGVACDCCAENGHLIVVSEKVILKHMTRGNGCDARGCVVPGIPNSRCVAFVSYLIAPVSLHISKKNTASTMEKEGFNEVLIEPLRQFARDSIHLVKKCTKPDRKEFTLIARATGIGFLIMGFIGFFVKLVHIPINNILVGS
jgi:protein transport protein SEC61 subunit gamma-like protein